MTARGTIPQRQGTRARTLSLLALRLIVGFGFAAHGYAKLARGPERFAAILQQMGIPAPGPVAWATSLLELVGGIALMLGAYVVPLSLPLAAVMATAMFGVHLRYGFSSVRLQAMSASGAVFGPVGYELNLLYIGALAAVALGGTSPLSVDLWRRARRRLHGAPPASSACSCRASDR
jgi:putative oxidoreductase